MRDELNLLERTDESGPKNSINTIGVPREQHSMSSRGAQSDNTEDRPSDSSQSTPGKTWLQIPRLSGPTDTKSILKPNDQATDFPGTV